MTIAWAYSTSSAVRDSLEMRRETTSTNAPIQATPPTIMSTMVLSRPPLLDPRNTVPSSPVNFSAEMSGSFGIVISGPRVSVVSGSGVDSESFDEAEDEDESADESSDETKVSSSDGNGAAVVLVGVLVAFVGVGDGVCLLGTTVGVKFASASSTSSSAVRGGTDDFAASTAASAEIALLSSSAVVSTTRVRPSTPRNAMASTTSTTSHSARDRRPATRILLPVSPLLLSADEFDPRLKRADEFFVLKRTCEWRTEPTKAVLATPPASTLTRFPWC